MVSQSSSVGYTIMGRLLTWQLSKRRPLTPCTRRARHKRSLQKRLAVHRAVSKHINGEAKGRKRCGRKSVQAIGITAPWRGLWNKTHSKMWGRFTKSGLQLDQEPLRTDVCKTWVSAVAFLVSSHSLNNRQRQKRLAWAKDKKDWTAAEWSKVMFSDESKFCISFGNQGPRVWRKRGEAQNPRCLRSSVKFPQSVMVWGAMPSAGVGPLCFLRSKVNTAIYQEILEHFMLPAADQLYGDADFIFQQDLAPAHSAKATSTWFKDHGIPVLNWPANSPDLNPIENLWGIVKRKMRYTRPNNAEELKATIRATWALITPEQCHRLIDSCHAALLQ